MKKLFYGDNLNVLRNEIKSESVDLVYLDPPFNSKASYNVLFKTPKGNDSHAQIEAFVDTWHWEDQAEREYKEIIQCGNTDVSEMIQALRKFLGENDMMAYLTMMANRLLELRRAMKPTASLYLHCDPTASHYLKIVLDGVFGKEKFRNEIIWKRTSSHNSAKRWGPTHDVIFLYTKSGNYVWNKVFEDYDEQYLTDFYRFADSNGRFRLSDLTGAGTRSGDSGAPWKGVDPTLVGRHWATPKELLGDIRPDLNVATMSTQEKLDILDGEGLIYWPPKGRVPQFKRYFNPSKGNPIQDVIADIQPIGAQAAERLGYPTQKPLALLGRIISASSNEGEVVLDPFCGCGTAVHAAEKLKRQWIGIDITHLAVTLIEKRMRDAFPKIKFEVHGTPKDLEGAIDLARRNKYQFQWWACSLVNAHPFQGKKKGADSGIDGLIYFYDDTGEPKKIIVSVKGGENVSVAMIRDLGHVVLREKAEIGLFITLANPTAPMRTEAAKMGFYTGKSNQKDYPKLQILTIDGLLNKSERAAYPSYYASGQMFKKAKKETPTPPQITGIGENSN